MEKKPLLTAAFVSVLLLSTAIQFVNLGHANPYIRDWKKVGDIPPPDGTLPPIISISSPKNNSAYASNNISLTLSVSMPKSGNVSLHISEIYYVPSWQRKGTGQPMKISASSGSINLTDIPEGPRWLEVFAVATTFAYETRHEVKDHFYTTYYVGYKITSSSVVNFTIDTTPPIISALSVESKTYCTADVPLNVIVNEPVSQVAYSLDGHENVTIDENTILTGLSNGTHNVKVCAWDIAGNIGFSETITFTIAQPEPFPTTLVVAPITSVAVIGAGLMIYLRKRNGGKNA